MRSRISSKGQVTVPIGVREELGLTPGTSVHFFVREGEAVMRKGAPDRHPVDEVYGSLRVGRPVDELVDEMRGPRPRRRRPKNAHRPRTR